MIAQPTDLLAGIAARAALATERKRALLNQPPLTGTRAHPLLAGRSVASDDITHPNLSSMSPSGSAVEAGRPANLSGSCVSNISTDYIQRQYGVPATIGGRVNFTGSGRSQPGTIVSVEGARLRIQLDGETYVGLYHPTWELEYLDGAVA